MYTVCVFWGFSTKVFLAKSCTQVMYCYFKVLKFGGENPQNIHSAYIMMFSFSECYTRQFYTMFDRLEQSIMGGDEELSQDHSMA